MISAHLGCLPENLSKLGEFLDTYPHLFVDTGSTRWMIRELGKDSTMSRGWVIKYQDRILFGSDISNIAPDSFFFRKHRRAYFWASRYWSHRLFWETPHKTILPFKDKDSPNGTTINGLHLPKAILEKIYYKNAESLLKNKN